MNYLGPESFPRQFVIAVPQLILHFLQTAHMQRTARSVSGKDAKLMAVLAGLRRCLNPGD
jgi:hypothetical protein